METKGGLGRRAAERKGAVVGGSAQALRALRMNYVPPTPHPCANCGVAVVYEFGVFDAADHAAGALTRHFCEVELTPVQLNERDFVAHVKDCPDCQKKYRVVEPVPPSPAEARKPLPLRRRPNPPPERGGVTGIMIDFKP